MPKTAQFSCCLHYFLMLMTFLFVKETLQTFYKLKHDIYHGINIFCKTYCTNIEIYYLKTSLNFCRQIQDHKIDSLLIAMNQKLALFIIFAITITCKPINITDFWKDQIKGEQVEFQSFAGYEEIDWYRDNGTSGIYYQLFGARGANLNQSNQKIPLFLWLQGGPGASSLFGAYTQIGPIRIIEQKPILKHNSWNLIGHLLFVDQPLNAGFSYDSARQSDKQVSTVAQACDHLLNFLYNFYKEWPQLQTSPLYIVGESIGGRYASGIANLLYSNGTFKSQIKVTTKGVVISSGWMDPANQMNFYDSLLYSAGIVSDKLRDVSSSFQTRGIVNLYKKEYKNASQDFDFLTKNKNFSDNYWGGMSFLNIRSYEKGDYSMDTYVQTFKKQLGVKESINYITHNDRIYNSFKEQMMKSAITDLKKTIKNNIKVLVYNGQYDYTVNTAGVLNYLNTISLPTFTPWKTAKKNIWRQYTDIIGWTKVYKNFWFAVVNGAGHKITTDQPNSCFDLLGRFVYDDQNWNQ